MSIVAAFVWLVSLAALASASSIVVGISTLHGVVLQQATDVSGFSSAATSLFVASDGGSGPGFVTTVKKNSSTVVVFYVLSNSSVFAQNATTLWPANGYAQLTSNLSTLSSNHFGQLQFQFRILINVRLLTNKLLAGRLQRLRPGRCSMRLELDDDCRPWHCGHKHSSRPSVHLQLSSCSLVTVTATSSSVSTATVNYDPYFILDSILSGVHRPSRLSFLRITSIEVDGVVVYTSGSTEQDSYDGTFDECAKRLWYLLFLILLVPLTYIVASKCYRRGKLRGKEVAKEQDAEAKKKAELLVQQQHRSQWMTGSARF